MEGHALEEAVLGVLARMTEGLHCNAVRKAVEEAAGVQFERKKPVNACLYSLLKQGRVRMQEVGVQPRWYPAEEEREDEKEVKKEKKEVAKKEKENNVRKEKKEQKQEKQEKQEQEQVGCGREERRSEERDVKHEPREEQQQDASTGQDACDGEESAAERELQAVLEQFGYARAEFSLVAHGSGLVSSRVELQLERMCSVEGEASAGAGRARGSAADRALEALAGAAWEAWVGEEMRREAASRQWRAAASARYREGQWMGRQGQHRHHEGDGGWTCEDLTEHLRGLPRYACGMANASILRSHERAPCRLLYGVDGDGYAVGVRAGGRSLGAVRALVRTHCAQLLAELAPSPLLQATVRTEVLAPSAPSSPPCFLVEVTLPPYSEGCVSVQWRRRRYVRHGAGTHDVEGREAADLNEHDSQVEHAMGPPAAQDA